MSRDLTSSTADLCERADAACAESRQLVQDLEAGLARTLLALYRLEASIGTLGATLPGE